LRLINKAIFLLIFLFFGAYLFGVNSLSVRGFELSETNKKINDLNSENAELELKTMQLESYANINEKVKNLGLVKIDKIDYITPSIGVARK
jgi:cell division protein FtsL